MTTSTPHGDAVTWRDLADQLTPEQVAEVEYCEREDVPPGLASPQGHLNHARALIERNIIQALCADVPAPPDAGGEVFDWEPWEDGGHGRLYVICTKTVTNAAVDVFGVQHDDGRVERFISPQLQADEPMTAQEARELGALLIEAAGQCDRLSGHGCGEVRR